VVKEGSGRLVYKQINAADQPDSRLQQNGAIAYNRLTTPRGGLFQVTLPDGSRVWLNSASSLKYPASFSGQERRVELTGEGYFEVAADKSRPFFVALNNMQVQVLGTDFNVMAYEDEEAVRTSLVSGSVCIISGEETVTVKPGQQASRLKENGRVVLSVPNMEEVLGWRNGQMSFSSAALPAIMRQISRWYDVDIKYADGIPPGRFNGLIDRNLKLSNVLEVLEVYGIHSKLEGRTVTVLP
jgi:ferric-dicitrate binding protein FerR (iron transport regulator)